MNKIENQHRHGDVLLSPLDAEGSDISRLAPPPDAMWQERAVLAYGEATDTAHVLTGGVWVWETRGQRYVRTGSSFPGRTTLVQERQGAALDAPEGHAPQVLAPDMTFVVIPQREGTLDDEWAKVVD